MIEKLMPTELSLRKMCHPWMHEPHAGVDFNRLNMPPESRLKHSFSPRMNTKSSLCVIGNGSFELKWLAANKSVVLKIAPNKNVVCGLLLPFFLVKYHFYDYTRATVVNYWI